MKVKEKRESFLKRIKSLPPGERAVLKRAVGQTLSEADGSALSVFYRYFPYGVPRGQEDRWFAVACLACYYSAQTYKSQEETPVPLEAVIARLIDSDDLSTSVQHRIEILLDTAWDTDAAVLEKLVRLVKMVHQKSNRIPIDFGALLEDLIFWNTSTQSVQKKWARSIFGDRNNKTEDTETQSKEKE